MKSMGKGVLFYKCRLCGNLEQSEIAFGEYIGDITQALNKLRDGIPGLHACKDGRSGILDLAGGKPLISGEKEEPSAT